MAIPLPSLAVPRNSGSPLLDSHLRSSETVKKWGIVASSAAPGIDLKVLEAAIAKKDSNAVKEVLDQLSQTALAKKWSSQPYASRRMTSLQELTTLGIKNAENLAIPSVRNDAAFLFTVVGTTGFLGVITGQLPGDAIGGFSSFFPDYQERIVRHEAAHFLGGIRVAIDPLIQWYLKY